MRVITLLANKGGVGRTACAVVLTAAFLAHRRRVLLVDVGDEARSCRPGVPSPLERWRARVLAGGVDVRAADGMAPGAVAAGPDSEPDGPPPLAVVTARDVGELLAALDEAADAAALGLTLAPDVVLVDTAGRMDDRARVALRATDLVLAPFRNDLDARWVREGLREHLPPGLPFVGLPCGVRGGRQERERARAAFGQGPFLHMELPEAEGLLVGLWEGWLTPYRGRLGAQGWDGLDGDPGGGKRREAARAWTAALAIAQDALGMATRAADARERTGHGATFHQGRSQALRLVRPAHVPPWMEA